MRTIVFAVLMLASTLPAAAQLAPFNDLGLTMGHWHIISKDAGYDPLIQHLKAMKILAGRKKAISDIHLVKVVNSKSVAERIDLVLGMFRQLKAKPGTAKALDSTIASFFLKQLSDNEVSDLINELANREYLTISSIGNVTYAL